MNRKDRRGNKTTYLSGNTGIRLICEAVAVELLFYAMLAIFRSAFGWQLPIRALGKLHAGKSCAVYRGSSCDRKISEGLQGCA